MQKVLHKFSDFTQWQLRAETLYPQLPEITAETEPDDETVLAQLVRFYITNLLPDNGLFPKNLDAFIHAKADDFRDLLTERLTAEDPLGAHAPKYMQRKAANIQATYWMSLRHLAVSLIEESHARTIGRVIN